MTQLADVGYSDGMTKLSDELIGMAAKAGQLEDENENLRWLVAQLLDELTDEVAYLDTAEDAARDRLSAGADLELALSCLVPDPLDGTQEAA